MRSKLFAACLLAVLCGVSAGAQTDQNGAFAATVGRAVRESPHVTIFDDVDVRVDGPAVVLAGKVTTPAKKQEIERQVVRVDGVREVKNEILVLPPVPGDDDLRHRVARAIYGNPAFWSYAALPNPPIHIIVERGHVTLRGTVASQVERTMARSLASGLGEQSVVNELQTGVK